MMTIEPTNISYKRTESQTDREKTDIQRERETDRLDGWRERWIDRQTDNLLSLDTVLCIRKKHR